ncbi:hypothetical protein [Gilliamella sp. Pas-s27]|uniref:hypothetical protein n=1 Tax=Gilliamella sp. Pas-s27 TaxID=2687311 RepID=UPI001920B120|nr:hypothetical protein [Gilliamella sp. Pas-s27]
MNIHKKTKLTPYHKQEVGRLYHKEKITVTYLAKRYNKTYPSEILYVDTKCLYLLKNQTKQQAREYLFVGIDDFSRELYASIYPDKSQFSSAQFLQNDVLGPMPLYH